MAVPNLSGLLAQLLSRGMGSRLPTPANILPGMFNFPNLVAALSTRTGRRARNIRARRAQRQLFQYGFGMAGAGLGSLVQPIPTAGGVGAGLAGILGGLGTAAGAGIGGPGGAALASTSAALGTFGQVLFGSIDTVKNWSRALIDANFKMGEFSAAMIGVKVQQQIYDIQRSQRQGQELEPSAREAVEARERYMKKFGEPTETQLMKWWNKGQTWFFNAADSIQEQLPEIQQIRAKEKEDAAQAAATERFQNSQMQHQQMEVDGQIRRMGRPIRHQNQP